MSDNGRLKKLVGVLHGKEEKHPEGQYKVRWLENGKPRFDSVGNDPAAALMALNRREKALAAIAAGIEVKNTDGKQRYRIADAAAQYLAFVKENQSHKTWLAYSRNVKLFQESCAKTFLDQIDRADVLEFITACRKEISPRTGEPVGDRTVHNTFQNVNTFFLQNPLQQVTPDSMGFTRDQWKTLWNKTLTYVEQEVREYSEEETKKLFDACNDAEVLIWNFFLVTGMREQEVANCTWSDFNPSQGTVSVTRKINRELGVEFVPKEYEERTLRLTKDVIAALKKRRKTHSADYLIFPNADGKPNGHFLRGGNWFFLLPPGLGSPNSSRNTVDELPTDRALLVAVRTDIPMILGYRWDGSDFFLLLLAELDLLGHFPNSDSDNATIMAAHR